MWSGSIRSGVEENGVKEVSFGKDAKGSVLCVNWKSGHIILYHLCYCCVC